MATNVTVTRVYANPDHFQGKNTPQYVYSGAASSQGGGIQWLGSTLNAVGTYTAPGYITANDDMLWDSDLLSLGTKLTAAKQAADVVIQVGSVDEGAHGAVEIIGNQIINGTIGTLSFHNEASAHARNTVAELAVTRVGDADSGQITLKLADSDANLDDVYIVSELFHNWAVAGVSEMWLSDAALYPHSVGGLTLGTSGAPWGAAFAASALLTGMATTGNRVVYADSTGLLNDLSWLTWSGAGTLEIGTGLTFANFDFEYGGANPYSFSADSANGLYIHEYSTNIAKFTTALVTVVSPVRMDDLAGTGDRFIFADADGDIGDHAWFTAPATGTIEIGTGLTASSLAFEYGGTNPYELSANATDGMYIHLYSDKIMHFTDALITTVVAVRMDSLAGTGDRMVVADADGDLSTQAIPTGDSSPLTTKGDVYTFSTVDARLPVGTNGQILSADSTETTGLKWIDDTGGSTYTFSNGLTETAGAVVLGGTLTSNLTFSSASAYSIALGTPTVPIGDFHSYGAGAYIYGSGSVRFGYASDLTDELLTFSGLYILSSTMAVMDENNSKGLVNSNDFSANATDRSLIDKAHIESLISAGGSSYTFSNGLTETAGAVTLGGLMTGSISIESEDDQHDFTINVSDAATSNRTWFNMHTSAIQLKAFANITGSDPVNRSGLILYDYGAMFEWVNDPSNKKSIYFSAASMLVTDSDDGVGLQYAADYSANATDRSLIDKAHIESLITAGGTTYTFSNGLTETSGAVTLGASLSANVTFTANALYDMYFGLGGSPLRRIYAYTEEQLDMNFGTAFYATGEAGSTILELAINNGGKRFLITSSTAVFIDTDDSQGFSYSLDYSTNGISVYGDRWIPDKGYVDGAIAAGGSSPWTKTSTNLSPTTADDDILLPAASEIHFGTSTTKISLHSAGVIRVTANNNEVVDFNSNGNLVVYNTLQTDITDSSDIGTTTTWWKNIYAQKYVVDDVACYISAPSTAKMALTDGTGTRTLSGLSNYTVVRIQHSDDGVTLDLADLELGAVAWSDITIMMYVATAFDSSAPQLHIGNSAHTATYYLAAGNPGWASTGFKTFTLSNDPNFISGDETINCQYNDSSSDGTVGDAYLYFSYISP